MPGDPLDPIEPYRAGKAFLSLGFVLLVEAVVGVTALVVVMALKPEVPDPLQDPDALAALFFGGQAGFAVAVVAAGRKWARPLVEDRTPAGLGLVLPGTGALVASAAIGAALAGAFLAFEHYLYRPAGGSATLRAPGGLLQLALTVGAVLVAPPSEEYLFRGLLLKGFAASWGTVRASVAVTLLFVSLHFVQILHYWPSAVFYLIFSIAALAVRLRTGSLAPSMAMHAVYNLVVVGAAFL